MSEVDYSKAVIELVQSPDGFYFRHKKHGWRSQLFPTRWQAHVAEMYGEIVWNKGGKHGAH